MFHWICPECGREIAPGVKECPCCDPQSAQPVAEAVQVLVPELVDQDPEARLRELVGSMRGMAPAPIVHSAAPSAKAIRNGTPTTTDVLPISVPSSSLVGTPAMVRMLAPKIPDMAERLHDSALRAPEVAVPPDAAVLGSVLDTRLRVMGGDVALPPFFAVTGKPAGRAPHAAALESIEDQMASRVQAAAPPTNAVLSKVEGAVFLNGPRLPHELASLEGAGISRILRTVPEAPRPPIGSNIPGWVITGLVTATILAGCLSLAFYTIPGLANQTVPKQVSAAPVEVLDTPPSGSPLVEVTGVRIVTGSGKGSEIRYLVVNHSAVTLDRAIINVTLRLNRDKAGVAPISRFAFTAPGLRPYESREMVSPIQNMVSAEQVPDWRELRADVQLVEK